MKPFEQDCYVELTGTIASPESDSESFILLMGPEGKFLYRCGDKLQFSDGSARGSIDFSTFPRTEYVTRQGVHREDVAMAVGMVGGPYPFAAAHAAGDNRWLSALVPPNTAEFESKELLDGGVEITIRGKEREFRFVFSRIGMQPSVYQVRSLNDQNPAETEVNFSIVRFPKEIRDEMFQPVLVK